MSEIVLGGDGAGAGKGGNGALIKESSTATFMADVIEESRNQPVLVDFWAPWCGPCKQLTPVLEKAVNAARGAIKLVKVNVDENQDIAGQMGIQSIPAVFAFKDGRPVDGFMGALPESQVKAFIERVSGPIGPSDAEISLEAAQDAFEAGDIPGAGRAYAAVLQQDSQNADAIAGLTRCYLAMDDLEHARQTLALAGPDIEKHEAIAGARAALRLAELAADAGDIEPLKAAVGANPNDHRSRFDLAVALNGAGDKAGATDQLIELIRRDRNWNDEAARKQLLLFFEAWGLSDAETLNARRKLSSVLFA